MPYSPLQIGRAGKNLLLVLQDRFDHLHGGGRGRVVGAAGLQVLDDFGAAVAGALDDLFEARGLDQLGDRDAGDRGVAGQRNHGVAVAAQHEGGHVLHADVQLLGDESAEARRIEHAGHADDALAIEASLAIGGLRHRIQGIRDDDQDAFGRLRHHLLTPLPT